MTRKHVKVEPERWYYWCDKLGLLVWQDMPSGDQCIGAQRPRHQAHARVGQAITKRELKAMIDGLPQPSVHRHVGALQRRLGPVRHRRASPTWIKKYDPTRLVNNASGWTDRGVGDVHDMHDYPGPGAPKPEEKRAAVLGEFGGLGLAVDGHTWSTKHLGLPAVQRRRH